MSRQLHRWRGSRKAFAVSAVAALGLGAAACSSTPASSDGNVSISINCAPTQAQNPVQHKEWVADVATFEKANPTITVKSVYNYPCEVPATFTAMLRAGR
jgi:ABC-type glycerol-3-phosphate transport system substrate-binding protein